MLGELKGGAAPSQREEVSRLSISYDDLAARAERGELMVKPGTVLRGAEAAAAAQLLLMEATGATSADDLTPPALSWLGGRGPSS